MDDRRSREQLRLLIEYTPFLGAQQLADVLTALDRMHTAFYVARVPDVPVPLPPEARLRVDESRTGNSIELLLVEGVGQLWSAADAAIQVVESLGTVSAMAALITGLAKRLAGSRLVWVPRNEPRPDERSRERRDHEMHTEPVERSDRADDIDVDLSHVSVELRKQVTEEAVRLIILFEYDDNFERVAVNNSIIIDKRAARNRT